MASKNSNQNKKSQKSKTNTTKKGKKSKKSSFWRNFLIILIALVVVAWYFGGKPKINSNNEKFSLEQTEEPLINKITQKQIVPFDSKILENQNEKITENQSANGAPQNDFAEEKQKKSTQNVAKKSTEQKTEYSSADADLNHAENSPLFFGNPSDALSDTNLNENYLMQKSQYTLSYNSDLLIPNWVAWHLSSADINGSAERGDDFRADSDLPSDWYGVKKSDYQYNKYGFDRGHVCPSADRTSTQEDNSMTFLMTNMVPQSPDNNRVIWMHFENYERKLVEQGNEVYIIAGPSGKGGTSGKGTFEEIPITLKNGEVLKMQVPAYTWKVLIAIPEGDDDFERIGEDATVIAINVPNKMGIGKTGDWEQFITSIDEIESQTGYDFFELLPDSIEDVLEQKVYSY